MYKKIVFIATTTTCMMCLCLFSEPLAQYPNIRVSQPESTTPEEVTISINPTNPLNLAAGSNLDFSLDAEEALLPSHVSVSFNGTFVHRVSHTNSKANSENGIFWCRYDIGHVGDEVRELLNFTLFENDQLLFTMEQAPGSDISISNSGITAFMDMKYHYKNELTVHFHSKGGQRLFSETFTGATLFGFSPKGDKFGVGTTERLNIISVPDHNIETYERGFTFDISEDESLVAIALPGRAVVYDGDELLGGFETDFAHTRGIRISSNYDILAVIAKKHLMVFSMLDGCTLFADTLKGKNSFRDLILHDGKIMAGIHRRSDGLSKGVLRAYDCQGRVVLEREESVQQFKTFEKKDQLPDSSSGYEEIPWPFEPFDSMHTVWNYYEQHMGGYGADWSYLHQGLDIITPIGEPTYAVAPGIVKCVLTLGGDYYWRTAISKEQSAGYSTGWLYAHLIESTIQVDVGDTVQVFDYLGDIIEWSDDWGHIHFVEIQDTGLVWYYYDNEWGITYNPLLSLRPDTDTIPPAIEDVFDSSKFGFCINETSIYLDPDSLYGDIDIIVKVRDHVGDSEWEQPAFELYYWVKTIPGGDSVFPRTLGQILNHAYDFYSSDYYEPYATLLYKRDEFLMPSSWMSMQRNYYHILTNNNGDSLAVLSEKDLAFPTAAYPDGDYRVVVEAFDEYGNAVRDSMDVKFRNGVGVASHAGGGTRPLDFRLAQNFPNPFNPATEIGFVLPDDCFARLEIYNLLGERVACLVHGKRRAGYQVVRWDAGSFASGTYVYRLLAGDFVEVRRMVLLK